MPKFTTQNAARMAKKSHLPGSARFAAPLPATAEPDSVAEIDAFSADLSRVCVQTLEMIAKEKKPVFRAQLARSLRDLRETWHLATGKPRPGLTRPDMVKPVRREIPRSVQPMFNGNGHSQNTP